jgi:hypothetical protein
VAHIRASPAAGQIGSSLNGLPGACSSEQKQGPAERHQPEHSSDSGIVTFQLSEIIRYAGVNNSAILYFYSLFSVVGVAVHHSVSKGQICACHLDGRLAVLPQIIKKMRLLYNLGPAAELIWQIYWTELLEMPY